MRKIDHAAQLARAFVGCPYVFAATGQACTPALRKSKASAKPAYAEAIYKHCPALSAGKSCSACKYNGKRAFDCRGLTYICCKEAGLSISAIGATSQYWADDFIKKGEIDNMPAGTPCLVFRKSPSSARTMNHTGFYLGDGNVVDCRGHATGTVLRPLASYPWTHYAIPKGAYDAADAEPQTATAAPIHATLRKGSTGADVKTLQETLITLGYRLPKYGADGSFGAETVAALKQMQADNGLAADGICGPATWARLDALIDAAAPWPGEEETAEDAQAVSYTVTIRGVDAATATYLLECYPGAIITETAA